MEVSLSKIYKMMANHYIFIIIFQEQTPKVNGDIKQRLQKVLLKFMYLFKIIIIHTLAFINLKTLLTLMK